MNRRYGYWSLSVSRVMECCGDTISIRGSSTMIISTAFWTESGGSVEAHEAEEVGAGCLSSG